MSSPRPREKSAGSLSVGRRLDRIEGKLDKALTDIATLKVKSGLWGGLGALAVTLAMRLQGCG